MAEQFVRRRALFIRLDLARLLDEEPARVQEKKAKGRKEARPLAPLSPFP